MTDEADAPERLVPDPACIADAGEFARELTLARQHAGLTVRQVQKATGMVTSTLGSWFVGWHSPNPDALDAILRACGIDEPAAVRQWHGAALPTPTTAIPEPRSISELPSTSTSTPPPARSTNTGRTVPTPRATTAWRRSSSARDLGPGISVTRRRCWSSVGPQGARVVVTGPS